MGQISFWGSSRAPNCRGGAIVSCNLTGVEMRFFCLLVVVFVSEKEGLYEGGSKEPERLCQVWSKCVGGIKELVVLGVTLIARLAIEDARLR